MNGDLFSYRITRPSLKRSKMEIKIRPEQRHQVTGPQSPQMKYQPMEKEFSNDQSSRER